MNPDYTEAENILKRNTNSKGTVEREESNIVDAMFDFAAYMIQKEKDKENDKKQK